MTKQFFGVLSMCDDLLDTDPSMLPIITAVCDDDVNKRHVLHTLVLMQLFSAVAHSEKVPMEIIGAAAFMTDLTLHPMLAAAGITAEDIRDTYLPAAEKLFDIYIEFITVNATMLAANPANSTAH